MSAPLPSPPSLPAWLERRPTKRGDCPPPDQQCPWVSCRHHLAFDIKKKRHYGTNTHTPQAAPRLILALPEDPAEWPDEAPTCSLHVADGGAHTLEEIASLMGDLSRERVRQLEQSGLAKLVKLGIIIDIAEDLHLDTETRSPNYQRPDSRCLGSRPTKPPPREANEPHLGMNPERMTAAMVRIQAEAREACPTRTISPDAVDLAALEAEIVAKRNPLHKPRPLVTLDTFSQRAEASRMRAGAATASTTRITATPAKAPTTTTPRPPSPPSTAPLEIPPTIQAEATPSAPAAIQSDDYPEVAVVTALPDPSPTPPSPPSLPMTRPDMRTRRGAYAAANHTALTNLQKIMAERGLSRDALSALARDAYPAHTPSSVDQAVVKALHGTASPVSVWYRRLATLLGIPLSDLCADPVWLAAVAPEDSPVAAPHSHLPRLPIAPSTPPPSPPALPIPTPDSTLIPLLAEALRQAQATDKRVNELSAVTDLLRREIDDLQQQLAERTKERDAATTTLADIKRRLA